jgi:hypothetical protein
MKSESHPAAADRPSAASLLRDEATHYLGHAADDAAESARRLRWFAEGERIEHGLERHEWLTPEQSDRLRRLATLADLVAADARAVLAEVAG